MIDEICVGIAESAKEVEKNSDLKVTLKLGFRPLIIDFE